MQNYHCKHWWSYINVMNPADMSRKHHTINNTCIFTWTRSKTHKKPQKLLSNWCLTVYCLTVMMPEPCRQLKTGLSFHHFRFPHVSVNNCVCYICRYKLRHKLSIMVVVATQCNDWTLHCLSFPPFLIQAKVMTRWGSLLLFEIYVELLWPKSWDQPQILILIQLWLNHAGDICILKYLALN